MQTVRAGPPTVSQIWRALCVILIGITRSRQLQLCIDEGRTTCVVVWGRRIWGLVLWSLLAGSGLMVMCGLHERLEMLHSLFM